MKVVLAITALLTTELPTNEVPIHNARDDQKPTLHVHHPSAGPHGRYSVEQMSSHGTRTEPPIASTKQVLVHKN